MPNTCLLATCSCLSWYCKNLSRLKKLVGRLKELTPSLQAIKSDDPSYCHVDFIIQMAETLDKHWEQKRADFVGRCCSIMERISKRLEECIPKSWQTYTVVNVNEEEIDVMRARLHACDSSEEIKKSLLGNPERRLISKIWTTCDAWIKAMEKWNEDLNEGVPSSSADLKALEAPPANLLRLP